MKQAIVLGSNSDIYQQMKPLLLADEWRIAEWNRYAMAIDRLPPWDLVLVMMGRVAPAGMWYQNDPEEWDECMRSNLGTPLRVLRRLWGKRKPGGAVCWMAGSNPNMVMDGYSAYNTAKMGVLKLVEQLDHESPDTRFFALGPGTVLTKIHKQSEGWHNSKLAAARAANRSTPIERIYACLYWCLQQPKAVIGGRNICVSDPWSPMLAAEMRSDDALFKLRRRERSL